MLKFTGTSKDGRNNPLIGLGLSRENITRLAAGEPIEFKLRELAGCCGANPETTILIFFGETEESMAVEIMGAAPTIKMKVDDDPEHPTGSLRVRR